MIKFGVRAGYELQLLNLYFGGSISDWLCFAELYPLTETS
jgi:hypothetical protein